MNPFALDEPLVLRDPYLGRMSDDEFFNFCQSNRKWRIERNAAHDILLMAHTFSLTGKRNARLLTQLGKWWEEHQEVGEIFDSNAGFTLPNEAVRAPTPRGFRLAAGTLSRRNNRRNLRLCAPSLWWSYARKPTR